MSTASDRPNLPDDTLFMERANLVGDSLSQIAFGIIFVLTLQTLYALIKHPTRRGERVDWVFVVYTFIQFSFAFVFITINMQGLQFMFIDHREHVGGPLGFSLTRYSDSRNITANTLGLMAGWFADGLLLYIMLLPGLMYLCMIALGILFLYQGSKPGASLFAHLAVGFGVPYFSLTAGLNFILTSMIVIRLLMFRQRMQTLIGPQAASLSAPYTSVASLVVESSMIYAITTICFVIPYGIKSHVSSIFLPLLPMTPVISSILIIYRVALRRAWDSNTIAMSSLQFRNTDVEESRAGEKSERAVNITDNSHTDVSATEEKYVD